MTAATTAPLHLHNESLDQEGRGVAHADGKVVFVEGALPGEEVLAVALRDKSSFAIARVERILAANAGRVIPRCPHFGVCGGCTLQHAHPSLQIAAKQRALEDALTRIGKVRPERMLPPVEGPAWGYRYRARLSVRYVAKKGGPNLFWNCRISLNRWLANMAQICPAVSDRDWHLRGRS